MTRVDSDHPRCDLCREPEPCDCGGFCELCGLEATKDNQQPCRGEMCQEVEIEPLTEPWDGTNGWQ